MLAPLVQFRTEILQHPDITAIESDFVLEMSDVVISVLDCFLESQFDCIRPRKRLKILINKAIERMRSTVEVAVK